MDYSFSSTGNLSEDDYHKKLVLDAEARSNGIYPRTIFVGLGGSGAKSLLHLRRMILERFGMVDALQGVSFLSIDTDTRSVDATAEDQKQSPQADLLRFGEHERFNLSAVLKNYVGDNLIRNPHIEEWWDNATLNLAEEHDLEKGAGQMRPVARLVFFANEPKLREKFLAAHTRVTTQGQDTARLDLNAPVRIVIVAGLAGGTGSGTFLDVAAMIRSSLEKEGDFTIEGYFVLPEPFRSVEKNFEKAEANGFAALRELNHYLTHPFVVRWQSNAPEKRLNKLYDRYVLITGTNYNGQRFQSPLEVYRLIGETLFLDFSAGPMSGWIQGVRNNRSQYLMDKITYNYLIKTPQGPKETHGEEWKTAFSTLGLAKLVSPAWRMLNAAKYELAARMVGLMDPGRDVVLKDLITTHRDRFMYDTGFFQGELADNEGVIRSFNQVHDALTKISGVDAMINSTAAHVQSIATELVDMSDDMFDNQSTEKIAKEKWRRVAGFVGDAESPGQEGDWVKQIRDNRTLLVKHVAETLPHSIEDYRNKPAVGPSGVSKIIAAAMEILERPADQARYVDSFRSRKPFLSEEIRISQTVWDTRMQNAQRASQGLLRSRDNHKQAILRASESLVRFWQAKVELVVCEEAIKALEEIRGLLDAQMSRLAGICQRMFSLKSGFGSLGKTYAAPQESVIIKEIPIKESVQELLQEYLGFLPEDQEKRLTELLQRSLRDMGLATLTSIENILSSDLDKFKNGLVNRAFYALRGEEGVTSAFLENGQTAFVERLSALKLLQTTTNGNAEEMQRRIHALYNAGIPWVRENQKTLKVEGSDPKSDAFLGVNDSGADRTFSGQFLELFNKSAERAYNPQRVRTNDVSELIYYTESNAFPIFFLSEIESLQLAYQNLAKQGKALHTHRDFNRYQRLIPLGPDRLAIIKDAWTYFLKALVLGLIRTKRLTNSQTDRRIGYQYQEKNGLTITWTDLGELPQAISYLADNINNPFLTKLSRAIEDHEQRFLQSGGSYEHISLLFSYYFYCVYPSTSQGGSMANFALADLQEQYEKRAKQELLYHLDPNTSQEERESLATDRFEKRTCALIRGLADWSTPIARSKTELVPFTAAVPEHERIQEWAILGDAEKAVDHFVQNGILRETRLRGESVRMFPPLAVNWDYFLSLPRSAKSGEPEFIAIGDAIACCKISCRELQTMAATHAPDDYLELSSPALSWPWQELNQQEVQQYLHAAPPLPEVGRLYYYLLDNQDKGQLPANDIAASVLRNGQASHRVWMQAFGACWKNALDVEEIREEMRNLGPAKPPVDPMTPPPDDVTYHYTADGQKKGALTAEAIAAAILQNEQARHRIWTKEFGQNWKDALDVASIKAAVQALKSAMPPADDVPPPDFD